MTLESIFIYPIKGLGGIALDSARIEKRGLAFDRRWMLVDDSGQFLSQRTFPQLALLQPSLEAGALRVVHAQAPDDHLVIQLPPYSLPLSFEVTIWEDRVMAQPVDPEADKWFTHKLGRSCRLVYMPNSTNRKVNPKYSTPEDIVSFADGYPYLIIGTASLDLLNEKLPNPVTIKRFRPNLVFSGGSPHVEDTWNSFKIGETRFAAAKKCGRCQVVNIDPETGDSTKTTLATLATYRLQEKRINFGLNACPVPASLGNFIEVGQEVRKA